MPTKVLVIPDKFKGTLSAEKAAHAIASGWSRSRPHDTLTLLPMSDGGDGFGKILGQLLSAERRSIITVDAAHRPITAYWWLAKKQNTAIIESASIIGLARLPTGKYHPFDLDTFGLGKVLMTASNLGVRRCIIGIGGSATNDGGFGLARALGWKFLDRAGNQITRWQNLPALQTVKPGNSNKLFREILVAVDVGNPLLGPRGASRVYGPQKGLKSPDFIPAERALRRLAAVLKRSSGHDYSGIPGAGAAGGLGFGLASFTHANLVSGFEMFAQMSRLAVRIRRADVIITGEGQIDRSTIMGKGVGELAAQCRKLGKPCIGIAGSASSDAAGSGAFAAIGALTDLTDQESAMAKPAHWLRQVARRLAASWYRRT